MGKSRDSGSYPETYKRIAEEFENGKRELTLTFPTQRDQVSTRLDLYGYIRALKGEDGVGLDKAEPLYPTFYRVRIFASQVAPWTLTLRHADDTFTGKFIDEPGTSAA